MPPISHCKRNASQSNKGIHHPLVKHVITHSIELKFCILGVARDSWSEHSNSVACMSLADLSCTYLARDEVENLIIIITINSSISLCVSCKIHLNADLEASL